MAAIGISPPIPCVLSNFPNIPCNGLPVNYVRALATPPVAKLQGSGRSIGRETATMHMLLGLIAAKLGQRFCIHTRRRCPAQAINGKPPCWSLYPFPVDAINHQSGLNLDDASFIEIDIHDSQLRAHVLDYSRAHLVEPDSAQSFRIHRVEGRLVQGLGLGWHKVKWKDELLWILSFVGPDCSAPDRMVIFAASRGRGKHLLDFCKAVDEPSYPKEQAAKIPVSEDTPPTQKFYLQELVEEAMREQEEEERKNGIAPRIEWEALGPEESNIKGAQRLGIDFDPLAPP